MCAWLDFTCVTDWFMIEIMADSANPVPAGLPINRLAPSRMAGIILLWAGALFLE